MFSSNMDSLGCQTFKWVNWALVLGLYLGDVIKGLLLVLGPFLIPFWTCVLGLRLEPAHLLFQTPSSTFFSSLFITFIIGLAN